MTYPQPSPTTPAAKKSRARWWFISVAVLIAGFIGSQVEAANKERAAAAGVQTATSDAPARSTEPLAVPPSVVTETVTSVVATSLEPVVPAEEVTSNAAEATPSVGEPNTLVWSDGRGKVTLHRATWYEHGGSDYIPDPANGRYLTIELTVEAIEGSVPYNPLYFSVKNDLGQEYNVDPFAGGREPALQSGDLRAPDKARGYIAFDVPDGPVKLVLSNQLLQPMASWAIN